MKDLLVAVWWTILTVLLIMAVVLLFAPRARPDPAPQNYSVHELAESVTLHRGYLYVVTRDHRVLRCQVGDVAWYPVELPQWPQQAEPWRLSGGDGMVAWALDDEGSTQIVVMP